MNRKLVASSAVALAAALGALAATRRPAAPPALPAPDTAETPSPEGRPTQRPAPHARVDLDDKPVPISEENKADFIESVEVSPPDPCAGDTVLVTIHPTSAAQAVREMIYSVKDRPGNPVSVTLRHEGEHRFVARARNQHGKMDARWVKIAAKACPEHEALEVRVRPGDDRRTHRFYARSAKGSAPAPGARYHWDFGDGTSADTDKPYAEHRYAVRAGKQRTTSFPVEVVASVAGGERARGRTAVGIHDLSFDNLSRFGVVALEIAVGPVQRTKDGITAPLHVENPSGAPVALDKAMIEPVACDQNLAFEALTVPASAILGEARIGGGATLDTSITLGRDAISRGVCRVVVKLEGQAPGVGPARGMLGLVVQRSVARWLDASKPEDQALEQDVGRAFALLGRDPKKDRVSEQELASLREAGMLGDGATP